MAFFFSYSSFLSHSWSDMYTLICRKIVHEIDTTVDKCTMQATGAAPRVILSSYGVSVVYYVIAIVYGRYMSQYIILYRYCASTYILQPGQLRCVRVKPPKCYDYHTRNNTLDYTVEIWFYFFFPPLGEDENITTLYYTLNVTLYKLRGWLSNIIYL